VTIELEKDTATPWLRKLQANITSHHIGNKVGPAGTKLVQEHFRRLGENKRGWPSTNFYGRAAKATNWQPGSGFVDIVVANQIGLRQRLMGGDIKPVKAGALTIPAQPETYGKTAHDVLNLKFGFALDPELGVMRPALVEKSGIERGKKGKKGQYLKGASVTTGLVALFWLAKGVHQKADPNVMPSDGEFSAMFDRCVKELIPK
jgi:hypothetical protein